MNALIHEPETIVEYDANQTPLNEYPYRIVSPPRPGVCCATGMDDLGGLMEERGEPFVYRRCRECGYTVRRFRIHLSLGLREAGRQD